MEPLGTKLRRQRRRLGFTLDELAGKTGISKPYLSLIETGRVANPPSDEKLSRLEQHHQIAVLQQIPANYRGKYNHQSDYRDHPESLVVAGL